MSATRTCTRYSHCQDTSAARTDGDAGVAREDRLQQAVARADDGHGAHLARRHEARERVARGRHDRGRLARAARQPLLGQDPAGNVVSPAHREQQQSPLQQQERDARRTHRMSRSAYCLNSTGGVRASRSLTCSAPSALYASTSRFGYWLCSCATVAGVAIVLSGPLVTSGNARVRRRIFRQRFPWAHLCPARDGGRPTCLRFSRWSCCYSGRDTPSSPNSHCTLQGAYCEPPLKSCFGVETSEFIPKGDGIGAYCDRPDISNQSQRAIPILQPPRRASPPDTR